MSGEAAPNSPSQPEAGETERWRPRRLRILRLLRPWIILSPVAALLVVIFILMHRYNDERQMSAWQATGFSALAGDVKHFESRIRVSSLTPDGAGRKVVRTAQISIVTPDFPGARAKIEGLGDVEGGYLLELKVGLLDSGGQLLAALLRVPENRLDAVLVDLRRLGRVQEESVTRQDVTEQHTDLVARLANARETEERLRSILRRRAAKVGDILKAEKEIGRVREEIESMERRRLHLEQRIQFSEVQVQVREEYTARFQTVATPTPVRFRNALVEGGRNALDNLIGTGLFLLRYGPTVLFWLAVVYWPGRWGLRRIRSRR